LVSIELDGRTDLTDLFAISDVLSRSKKDHYPFLVFIECEQSVKVSIYKEIDALIDSSLDDSTKIMIQWAGQWRSDFFQFTLGDLKKAYKKRYGINLNKPEDPTKMEKYYKKFEKEFPHKKTRQGTKETKAFRDWYMSKKEMEKENRELKKANRKRELKEGKKDEIIKQLGSQKKV